ncbi:MAG: thiol:disulfide interchange protein DsbA/DsbL [Gammaproteobacteria bacterium]|nr:MAG: thiol:disulfide interchange protein DsbA/DsbL [Gammaproteobacteria bacterium]RKZ69315.1 MAG: thiol:disulfide interchange protein DsbA/DsbL [Gammaproteobacteria bacterium]
MIKKTMWSPITSIFLLAALSSLSACSDAEENVSKNKIEAAPAIQEQVVTTNKAQGTEVVLKDVTGLYKKLPTPQPTSTGDKIEVLEVFWYGCPHCYHFEPVLDKWLDEKPAYIEFVRMPGILGKNWLPHARAFYAAEKLGVLDMIHKPLFDAIHNDKRKILDEKSLRVFFSEYGVSGDEFDQAYNSKEVEEKVKAAFTAGQGYALTGVPAIIINGKYGTSASIAGSFEKVIDVINTLAAKEYKELNE